MIQLKSGFFASPGYYASLNAIVSPQHNLDRKHIGFFCYLYHAKMYNLNVFWIGLFCSLIIFSIISDQKQNRLSFGQKRQIVCLLDDGVSHFVDRLDSFCTYLSSNVDLIDNISNKVKSSYNEVAGTSILFRYNRSSLLK